MDKLVLPGMSLCHILAPFDSAADDAPPPGTGVLRAAIHRTQARLKKHTNPLPQGSTMYARDFPPHSIAINGGEPFDVVTVHRTCDDAIVATGVLSLELRPPDVRHHAMWVLQEEPAASDAQVTLFATATHYVQRMHDAYPPLPKLVAQDLCYKKVAMLNPTRAVVVRADEAYAQRRFEQLRDAPGSGGAKTTAKTTAKRKRAIDVDAPVTMIAEFDEGRLEEVRRLTDALCEQQVLLRRPTYDSVVQAAGADAVEGDGGADALARPAFVHASMEVHPKDAGYVWSRFAEHDVVCLTANLWGHGPPAEHFWTLWCERAERLYGLMVQDMKADPAKAQARRAPHNYPLNFLAADERCRISFEGIAEDVQGSFARLPRVLAYHHHNYELGHRDELQARLDELDRAFASWTREALHRRRRGRAAETPSASASPFDEQAVERLNLQAQLHSMSGYAKITPPAQKQVTDAQALQLLTCFYNFEIRRHAPSFAVCRLLLRCYRWHGTVARYGNGYTHTGKHCGLGNTRRAFAAGSEGAAHQILDAPTSGKRINGRGRHSKTPAKNKRGKAWVEPECIAPPVHD